MDTTTKEMWIAVIRTQLPDHWIPKEVVDLLATVMLHSGVDVDGAKKWADGGGVILWNAALPWFIAMLTHGEDPWVLIDEMFDNDIVSIQQGHFDTETAMKRAFEFWFWDLYRSILRISE